MSRARNLGIENQFFRMGFGIQYKDVRTNKKKSK